MASQSIATAIEKSMVASDAAYLLFVEIFVPDREIGGITEVIRLVNNPEDVTLNGMTFVGVGFNLSIKSEAGGLPSVDLSIIDTKGIVRSYMERYAGGVDFEVAIHAAFSNCLDAPPDCTEYFSVLSARASGYSANFSLGAENPLSQPFPRRKARRDYCCWRYRDDQCGYKGPLSTCDYTLQGEDGCAKHGNTARFGGFPGLNNSGIRYG